MKSVLLIGLGRFGKHIAMELKALNHQVMAVDTREERVDFLRRATADLPNVEVDAYGGLLAEYAHNVGACTIIKGLRAVTDFEFEFQQALTNKKLNPELETMFVITDPEYMYLSSSMVRQVASFGGDVTDFLPDGICKDIVERLTQGRAKE